MVWTVSRSLSARRAWIEIRARIQYCPQPLWSLSARRAWIEIKSSIKEVSKYVVALRKESVDRNNDTTRKKKINPASLSARRAWIEIAMTSQISVSTVVALRKESVDRNKCSPVSAFTNFWSLSARRAWIEIGVNLSCHLLHDMSLSARRAWIEMMYVIRLPRAQVVALRKESVDRNIWVDKTQSPPSSRSPQGERG